MTSNGLILSPSRSLQPSSDARASITHSTSSPILKFLTLKLKTLIPKLFRRTRPASPSGPLPPELLEAVIDNADSHALLQLSLLSRYALKRARIRLFRTLDFDHRKEYYDVQEDKYRFDLFFDMIQNPKNTIAHNIKILSINGLFGGRLDYKTQKTKVMTILASRLSQLNIDQWDCIPPRILEFFLRLRAAEVHIENTRFRDLPSFSKLFQTTSIKGASNNLSLYYVEVRSVPHLAPHSYTFPKQLHFSFIDDVTLLNFCQVWDLGIPRPQITIDSLFLADTRAFRIRTREAVAFDFLMKISRHVGPSIKRLFLSFFDLRSAGAF
ncbi:hypothetical protein H0H92_008621 [Tricholoma furcatifolium]|nr:hypothetical protein H0H92_008621 [Tricholoma furcatifolium]